MTLWQVDAVVVPGVASPEPVSFSVAEDERFAVIYDAEAGLGAVLAGLEKPVSGTFTGPSVVLASPDVPLPPRETVEDYLTTSAALAGRPLAPALFAHVAAAFGLAGEKRRLGDLPLAPQRLVTLAAALVAAMPAAGNVAVVAENPGRGLSDVARAAVLTALEAASTALGVSVLVLEPRSAPKMR
jgi:ABC-type multidrug transport system ATPase subunit